MKTIPNNLLAFQNYAKILLRKIHPDIHHGFPEIQKVNAVTVDIINDLFKFQIEKNRNNSLHNLNFFLRTKDKLNHKEIAYKLIFKYPFDQVSGKSALNLFLACDIPVDLSIANSLPSDKIVEIADMKSSSSSDAIKNHCFNLVSNEKLIDIKDALQFLKCRPFIQFEGSLPKDVALILKIVSYLSLVIHRLERKLKKMPLILISDRFSVPENFGSIVHIPLRATIEAVMPGSIKSQIAGMGTRNFNSIGKKIIGIGRNYLDHSKEMSSPIPKEPIIFLKPTTSYVLEPSPILIPENLRVDHEVELGVVIGRAGSNIKEENALKHVAGYAIALDLTAREIQDEAKKSGLPWTIAKGYDTFCPISAYIPASNLIDPSGVDIWCKVNDELRQKGNTRDMIFPIPKLISYLSSIMRLEPGDFILTGTPAGVGPIKIGDNITAGLGHDYMTMRFKVVKRPEVLNKF